MRASPPTDPHSHILKPHVLRSRRYAGYAEKLEALQALNAKDVFSKTVFVVMNKINASNKQYAHPNERTEPNLADPPLTNASPARRSSPRRRSAAAQEEVASPPPTPRKNLISKTVHYDRTSTPDKAEEGRLFIEELMRHFDFFASESHKIDSLKQGWEAACKDADADGSGDLDEGEAVVIWKNMVDSCLKRTRSQQDKLEAWRKVEAGPGSVDGVAKVLGVL